jgi:hypothetical protein
LVAEIPAPQQQGGGSSSNANISILTGYNDKGLTKKKKKQYKLYSVSSLHLVGPSTTSFAAGSTASGTDGGGGVNSDKYHLFVSYRKRIIKDVGIGPSSSSPSSSGGGVDSTNNISSTTTATSSAGGVCCYELGGIRISSTTTTISATSAPLVGVGGTTTTTTTMSGGMTAQPPFSSSSLTIIAPVVTARYDMDGRDVSTSCFCDGVETSISPVDTTGNNNMNKTVPRYAVARADGLHMYSPEEKMGICPIDGSKIAMCSLPPPPMVNLKRPVRRPISSRVGNDGTDSGRGSSSMGEGGGVSNSPAAAATTAVEDSNDGIVNGAGALYTLVATTDIKLGRDAVDIYDTTNKLVGFHVLLSPGHRALRAVGLFSYPMIRSKTLLWGGRSSAAVLTSGGSIVTLTERIMPEKIDLLTQKNLYPAAISMAYSDPQFYRPEDIVTLYRRYAEHLFKKGDFSAAIEQYIQTIGSLESSHVIFRFLDAPKIFLAVKYLNSLRAAGLSSSVHDQLLRTCYLKLGDVDAASKIMTLLHQP